MSNRSSPSGLGGEMRAGWAALDSGEVVELADRWQRLSSRFLDLLLFGIPALVLLIVLPDDKMGLFNIAFFSLLVAGIVYEVVLVAVRGQTLGRRAAGLKVISAVDGAVPGWARSILRCAMLCSFLLMLSLCSRVSRYAWDRGFGPYVWALWVPCWVALFSWSWRRAGVSYADAEMDRFKARTASVAGF